MKEKKSAAECGPGFSLNLVKNIDMLRKFIETQSSCLGRVHNFFWYFFFILFRL